ncbi:MAG: hypothetical protein AAF740_10435, partial [Bacteroidota bacterium]
KYQKSPVDNMLRDLSSKDNFAILLHDFNIKEGSFSDEYQHMYKVTYEVEEPMTAEDKTAFIETKREELLAKGDTASANNIVAPETKTVPKDSLTKWYDVSEDFFAQHTEDMGMELASKYNGEVSKVASPPGYNRYVGNSNYGHWQTGSNGNSFWAFYGQYAFMSSMMGYGSPIYRSGYNDYRRSYSSGRPYYGSTTGNKYGSKSAASQQRLSGKSSSFRSKMSRVQRSSSSRSSSSRSGRSSGSSSRGRSGGSSGGK